MAKIVCRLIKRKQNLPINEMWQLSVNFIGARLPGDIAVVMPRPGSWSLAGLGLFSGLDTHCRDKLQSRTDGVSMAGN